MLTTRTVLLISLTLGLMPWSVAAPADAIKLQRIVTDHYYVVGENRLEDAMRNFHEDSPQFPMTRQQIAIGQSDYLQCTNTLSFNILYCNGASALAFANHRHLRIVGIKFIQKYVKNLYVLRLQHGAWKLWSSVSWSSASQGGKPWSLAEPEKSE